MLPRVARYTMPSRSERDEIVNDDDTSFFTENDKTGNFFLYEGKAGRTVRKKNTRRESITNEDGDIIKINNNDERR